MRKILKVLWVLVVLGLIFILAKLFVFVPNEYKDQEDAVANCPTKIFDKSAVIFDSLTICATSGVPQDKLNHAANVAAQWLDNDQDGVADNIDVNNALKENKATVVMSSTGFKGLQAGKVFMSLEKEWRFGQDLYASETNPNGWRRDASQEELHHIISWAWWAKVYPKLFDDKSNTSKIYEGWQFSDTNKYYVYNDPTCDSYCKVMEHLYKSVAAYLNSSADLADTEFTIKNNKELREKHKFMVQMFESENYNYPTTMWPDGQYNHTWNIQYFPEIQSFEK